MIENGQLCPNCRKDQMPPWTSGQQTVRICQNCRTIEDRIREGYYWITRDGNNLCIGLWKGHNWFVCGLTAAYSASMFDIKGKVADWDGIKMS